MSIEKKYGVTSPDGEVQAKIEHYVDDVCARAIITATYRGRSGQLVFTAGETGVDVSFAGDEMSVAARNVTMSASETLNISGNNTAIQGSNEILISAGSRMVLQALSGALEISTGKSLNIGSLEKIMIKTLANIVLQAVKKLEIITQQLVISSANIRFGTGSRIVACIGDSVTLPSGTGTITGPGSTILRTD